MKNITKNLIVSTLVLGAFAFAQPGLANAATMTYTVFNTDNKPTAGVALGTQSVTNSNWSSSVTAEAGDTVTLKIRYKNTGNWDATNTKISIAKSDVVNDTQKTATYNVKIWADNTSYPAAGSVTLKYPGTETVSYVANSLKWYPNQSTVSAGLPFNQIGDEAFTSGLNIGVIKSKFACPTANPDCREGFVLLELKVSGTAPTIYQCNDGKDNDDDKLIDMNDPGCLSSTDNDEYDAPNTTFTISSVAASNINQTSAKLNASFANAAGGSAQVWFQYGTSTAFGQNTSLVTVNTSSGNASVNVTGLTADTTYYFRAVVKDSNAIKNASNTLNFTTTDTPNSGNLPPTVNAQSPTNVTETSATFRGKVNPNGVSTTVWFEYGTNESDLVKTVGTQNIGNDSNLISISVPVSNLLANTTYFYRAVASNSYGTVLGGIVSFKTESTVITNALKAFTSLATSVGGTSAKLNGLAVIDVAASTKVYFEYGKTIDLGKTTTAEVIGSIGQLSFNQVVSGLVPNTVYFYRAVAENSLGVSRGDVIVFKTVSSGTSNGNSGSNTTGLVSLKVASKFSEVVPGDIIDFTVSYKALVKIEDAILRLGLPEGMKFKKTTAGVYSKQDRALIVELGTLEKDKAGEVVVQVEITNQAKNEDLLALTALLTFNTTSGSAEDAIAYGVLKVTKKEGSLLGAAAIFGQNSFLPDTLIEWIILIAALAALILLGREIYFRGSKSGGEKVSEEPLAPANLPTGREALPQIPVSRYSNR